jgi:hypothetical protein
MQGVTVSLTLTFVVMLTFGFALLSLSDHVHQSLTVFPHALVQ